MTSSGFITSTTSALAATSTSTSTPQNCEDPFPCGGKALASFLGLVVVVPVVAFVLLLVGVFYGCRQYNRRKAWEENALRAAAAGQAYEPEPEPPYRYTTAARTGYKQSPPPPGYYASVCG